MFHKISIACLIIFIVGGHAFSIHEGKTSDRRSFVSNVASVSSAALVGVTAMSGVSLPSLAVPEIFTLKSGIKYAITKPSEKGQYPEVGDIVAIEYTGYLVNGQVSFVLLCIFFLF
jgi:hypothetical protein